MGPRTEEPLWLLWSEGSFGPRIEWPHWLLWSEGSFGPRTELSLWLLWSESSFGPRTELPLWLLWSWGSFGPGMGGASLAPLVLRWKGPHWLLKIPLVLRNHLVLDSFGPIP